MFWELKNTFKIVRLEEVLRCSNEISRITKSTQNFVRNKDSVFRTKMNKLTFEQKQQREDNKKLQRTTRSEISNPSDDFIKADEIVDPRMDLDQAFARSASLQKKRIAKSKIVSKFSFLCEPKQGVDIEGLKPNLVEFSEDINLASNIAVISLALVLKNFIGKNETTTILHMADDQPMVLKRTIRLLRRLLDKTFSFTQDIKVYLQKNKQSKVVFCTNFRSVNGMEFDHVIIVVSQSEYYLKYYLPQVISRCTYDLNFVLLPQYKKDIKKGFLQKLKLFSKTRNDETEETAADMIKELKVEGLVKHVVIAECKACEKNHYCYSILNETDDKQTFGVHTHSDQYQDYLFHLENNTESEEQPQATSTSALAEAK